MTSYGGIFERGSREYTLDDFYSLALDKLDRYVCLKPSELDIAEGDDASSSEDSDDDDDDDEEDKDSDGGNDEAQRDETESVTVVGEDEETEKEVEVLEPIAEEDKVRVGVAITFSQSSVNEHAWATVECAAREGCHIYGRGEGCHKVSRRRYQHPSAGRDSRHVLCSFP